MTAAATTAIVPANAKLSGVGMHGDSYQYYIKMTVIPPRQPMEIPTLQIPNIHTPPLRFLHMAIYHVMPEGDHWVVSREGATEDVGEYGTKQQALDKAEALKRRDTSRTVVVHGERGKIQQSF